MYIKSKKVKVCIWTEFRVQELLSECYYILHITLLDLHFSSILMLWLVEVKPILTTLYGVGSSYLPIL